MVTASDTTLWALVIASACLLGLVLRLAFRPKRRRHGYRARRLDRSE